MITKIRILRVIINSILVPYSKQKKDKTYKILVHVIISQKAKRSSFIYFLNFEKIFEVIPTCFMRILPKQKIRNDDVMDFSERFL